jgi:WD40 repeat protein
VRRTLAFEDNFPSIFFLDTASGRRLREITNLPGPPSALGYAPDGTLVMFGGNNPSEVDFIDPSTGRAVRRLPLPAYVANPAGPFRFRPGYDWQNFVVNNFAFADGGRRLAVAVSGYLLQWALPQGKLLTPPVAVPDSAGSVFYTAGGRELVAAGTQRTLVLDARTGRVVRSYRAGGLVAALSPDGTTMVFGDAAGSVRFLDLATGAVTQSASAHQGGVRAAGFTPDSRTAITSGNDGRTLVWDVATHQVVRTFAGHAGAVSVQAFSADGSTLYTGSDDGTAIAWDLNGKRSFGTTFRAAASDPNANAWNAALSPDGRTLAVGATDGTVNLWDLRTLRKIESFPAAPGAIGAVSFGAGGRSLLVAADSIPAPVPGVHSYLRIWSLYPKPRLRRELNGLPQFISWGTVSPDGKIVAAAGVPPGNASLAYWSHSDGLVAEWNAATGKLLARPTLLRGGGAASGVAFAARGTTVVVPQFGNKAAVVDPARRKILARWNGSPTAQYMLGAALSPDGTRVATADLEGYLWVRDAITGKPLLPGIRASATYLDSVAWSGDGPRLVTAGIDGTVRLYDARTGRLIGSPMPLPGADLGTGSSGYLYVTFSPDGRTIVATDTTGRVWLYPATAGWETYACRLANRELTRAEWSRFLPGHPYQQVCPR